MAVGGFVTVFAEVMVLAKVMLVPGLPLPVVGGTEGRGLLLTGKGPLAVLSVADVSAGVDFLMVGTSEGL